MKIKLFSGLRSKLIVSFAVILLLPSIVVGSLAYNSAKDQIQNQIFTSVNENVKLVNTLIDNSIKPKVNDIDYFSKTVSSRLYKGDDSPELRRIFKEYVDLHPEVVSIFVGTKNGLYVQMPRFKMPSGYDPRQRYWYSEAMNHKGQVVVTDPEKTASTGETVVTICKTTNDGSGVVAINIRLNKIKDLVEKVKVGKEGYAFLIDRNKKIVAHPNLKSGSKADSSFYDKLFASNTGEFHYTLNGKEKLYSYTTNPLTGWKVVGNMSISEVDDAVAPILRKTLLVIIISSVLGAIIVYFIIYSILARLRVLKNKAITISRGNLTEQIEIKVNDEIGQLGHAFNQMQENLRTLIQKIELSAEQVASSAEELTASAEQTSLVTEQVASSIQEVASNAETQTNGIDKNAQSLNTISSGITKIAENSMNVAELSKQSTLQAEEGEKAVQKTVDQMNSIHESVQVSEEAIQSLAERSKQIGKILDVITGIADQTNLLALNAAIEAARAGEEGRGFAVVAEEVRKLAEQSQESAKQIFELIQGIQQDTGNTVQIMSKTTEDVEEGLKITNEAFEKFEGILHSMREVAPKIQDISSTAQKISAEVQEVAAMANELANIAQNNAATSEEVASSTEEQLASMEEISASAKLLSSMAEELKEVISNFKY
ncbi:methyl-accepting chemotaxis protein [Bacillus sp. FSL W8-0102]|uniref:methyl-accepting chemotaxis protein n=1 Tax=Bacillus sp. FSL W8-0102 TaxID=2978205 RepID=UPI0030FAC7E5